MILFRTSRGNPSGLTNEPGKDPNVTAGKGAGKPGGGGGTDLEYAFLQRLAVFPLARIEIRPTTTLATPMAVIRPGRPDVI